MREPFDAIAKEYDNAFTETLVGKYQRERVHHHLEVLLQHANIHDVLELNCGTGQDAIWLAEQGCRVLATDIATKMVEVTARKILESKWSNSITSTVLDARELSRLGNKPKFDLIFSNFGGLNCIAPQELEKLAQAASNLLNPNGYFLAVIMPRGCWWEKLYFTLKKQRTTAKRRSSRDAIAAKLDEETFVDTWYYNPSEFFRYFDKQFNLQKKAPIGWSLPPSYLDNWFQNKKGLLGLLHKIEQKVPATSFFAQTADHCIVQMQRK